MTIEHSGPKAATAGDWRALLRQIDATRWELPRSHREGMRVPGVVFADAALLDASAEKEALEQVANVACLPGIWHASLAMPDFHWGYGFAVGGVAAMHVEDGVVSPGGVGFDINCGVRLLRSDLTEGDVHPHMDALVGALYRAVPTGTGSGGAVRLDPTDLESVLREGAAWPVRHGLGDPDDLEVTEERGRFTDASPSDVGQRPRERGKGQLGSLGSGNHFLEVDVVDRVFDAKAAEALGLAMDRVCVLVHCGSRGLGHQVCQDYVAGLGPAMKRYGIEVPDRQLACVPVRSPEGEAYLGAMRAAANFAWANRQVIVHSVRNCFAQLFGDAAARAMRQVYDVAHNVAKIEWHTVEGRRAQVCVHRKGATRAFPPGHPEVPERYRDVGQPVLVPGDMARYSFVAVGQPRAMEVSFGSTCHGAGRLQSRGAARRALQGRDLQKELADKGIVVRARGGWVSLAEESSAAYKDVTDVMAVCEAAGLTRTVARLRPLGVVKG